MSPALSRALNPLRFRPLLWMALAALCGVAAGGQWVASFHPVSRADPLLWMPLFPATCSALGIWFFYRYGLLRRLCLALLLFFCFACSAARRMTPPAGDVSQLTQLKKTPIGPIPKMGLKVDGVVADYPHIGDFNIQFPFACAAPYHGRIWVTAPYGEPIQIGDRLELLTELHPLPIPTNSGEKNEGWRYVGANCWCLGRHIVVAARLGTAPGYGMARRIGDWREGLLAHYETQFRGNADDRSIRARPFPGASAQLLTAMVFGEGGLSRPLPQVLQDDFRDAGLSHLLVASGEQVGLLLGLLIGFAHRVGFKRKPWLFLVMPILVFYALLAGGAVSIWRATLGGFLLLCAQLLGRDLDGLSIWGAAVLLMLLFDPLNAWSLSFQLTFAALWGILVIAPGLILWSEKHFGPSPILKLASASVGAQAATLPLSLLHFGSFSVSGVAANFLAVPLASLMINVGLLGLVFSPTNWANYYLARGVASLAHVFASLPGARFDGSAVPLPALWFYFGLLLVLMAPLSPDFPGLWEDLKKKLPSPDPKWLAALFLTLSVWLGWLQFGPHNPKLRVTMIDVGQGESILIRTPAGRNVLIDGGSLDGQARSDIGTQVLVPTLQSLGVDHLDLMILTHSDADHCNGLTAVAKEIPIDGFLDGPSAVQTRPDPSNVDYWGLRKTLAELKVPDLIPRAGQEFDLGEAKLQILGPSLPPLQSDNDNCIVSRLDFGSTSFLFTGDIEKPAEERLLERGASLKCTVLKVAHHGSLGSSTPQFLKVAAPQVALISCGRFNSFGHPGGATLRRLDGAGAAIFRTDVDGALEVECDQSACAVTTAR